MARSDFKLRSILLEIDRRLSDNERQRFCFLISSDDVPRRLLDIIAKDGSTSMNHIWETLFDRRKISTDNVNYIIERLENIERNDLAQLLKDYCPLPFSLSTEPSTNTNNRTQFGTNTNDIFTRINP